VTAEAQMTCYNGNANASLTQMPASFNSALLSSSNLSKYHATLGHNEQSNSTAACICQPGSTVHCRPMEVCPRLVLRLM
jgi:hypothetical protein